MKRLRILISAHELSPFLGSECSVGWNTINELSKHHDLHVLFATTNHFGTNNYSNDLKIYFKKNDKLENVQFYAIPQPEISLLLAKINKLFFNDNSIGFPPIYYLSYRYWQKKAYTFAKALHKKERFDLAHHLTAISFREPGFLWKLNIPFVWGPCSGLIKMPFAFYGKMKTTEILLDLIRGLSNFFQFNFSWRVRKAINKASLIFTVTTEDYNAFILKAKCAVIPMLDVGTDTYNLNNNIKPNMKINNEKIQLIWIGRLVYSKALFILLEALHLDSSLNQKIDLIIIGDGPLKSYYQNLSDNLCLCNIKWFGNLEHKDVLKELEKSDVLVHTSIKEATSAVILEALSFGIPVVCHDAFGMSIAINEKCGIKVPLKNPKKSVQGFRDAINEIVSNPDKLSEFKRSALQRSSELTWESKSKQIADFYNNVISNENPADQ